MFIDKNHRETAEPHVRRTRVAPVSAADDRPRVVYFAIAHSLPRPNV